MRTVAVARGVTGAWVQRVGARRMVALFHLAVDTAYLYGAAGTAYGATGVARVLEVAVLAAAVPAILLGYRFAILLLTLYST